MHYRRDLISTPFWTIAYLSVLRFWFSGGQMALYMPQRERAMGHVSCCSGWNAMCDADLCICCCTESGNKSGWCTLLPHLAILCQSAPTALLEFRGPCAKCRIKHLWANLQHCGSIPWIASCILNGKDDLYFPLIRRKGIPNRQSSVHICGDVSIELLSGQNYFL